jgi:hypothetical protein
MVFYGLSSLEEGFIKFGLPMGLKATGLQHVRNHDADKLCAIETGVVTWVSSVDPLLLNGTHIILCIEYSEGLR